MDMASGLLRTIFGGKNGHAEFRDVSSDYVDGEVTGDALVKANSHLDKCGPCRAFLDTLKATVKMLKSSRQEKAPPALKSEILENLKLRND
jgi:predicted anti-sigma-YlaC factor YlaD